MRQMEEADRPTFINVHHVEEGQGQRGLPAASATADPHLRVGEGGGGGAQAISCRVTPP